MDFFQGHENISVIDWALRSVVSFIIIVAAVKIMGLRAISQLRLIDFVIAFMLGNIIAHPLSDQTIGMKGSVVSTIILALLYILSVYFTQKWRGFRKMLDKQPFPLIIKGEIQYKGLKEAKISVDYLLTCLRKEKVEDIKKVALALWESDGTMSVFLDPKHQSVTPATMGKELEPFDLPKTIITDGRINYHELSRINKDEGWLAANLQERFQTEVHNVLLATVDRQNRLQVFLYK